MKLPLHGPVYIALYPDMPTDEIWFWDDWGLIALAGVKAYQRVMKLYH